MEFIQSISGLNAAYANIKTISNNIANISTTGFKSRKLLFNDVFTHSYRNNQNKGIGVKVSNITQDFSNGKKINTNNSMDVSINGNGFFKMIDSLGKTFYSRNGHFMIDKNYNIVNSQGMLLTGITANKNNPHLKQNAVPNIINLKKFRYLPYKPTTKAIIDCDLNDNDNLKVARNFNPLDPHTYNAKSVTTIYDPSKKTQKIHLFFLKRDDFRWMLYVMNNNDTKKIDSRLLEFDEKGKLTSFFKEMTRNYSSDDNTKGTFTIDMKNIMQKKVKNTIIRPMIQNGYELGKIKNVSIDKNGIILGKYSNKKTKKLAQIALFDVLSKNNLKTEDNSNWSVSNNNISSPKTRGIPGKSNFKPLSVGTLENSNVDLNKELISMIIAQRNYQSNAQAIKTQDKILNTLINLK